MSHRITVARRAANGTEQTSVTEVGSDAEAARSFLALAQEVMPADFPRPAWLDLHVELARATIAVEQRTGRDVGAVEVMVAALRHLRLNPPAQP